MTDEDQLAKIGQAGAAAALVAIDPTAGVATAMVAHVATNMQVDSMWRGKVLDVWIDVICHEHEERRRQYEETRDEFNRHRLVLKWLQEELATVLGRVEALEGIALHLLSQSEGVLRVRPDPDMRPYLSAAFRSALYRRNEFSPVWISRLVNTLAKVGPEHLKLLLELFLQNHEQRRFQGRVACGMPKNLGADQFLVWHELMDLKLLDRRGNNDLAWVTYFAVRLLNFVDMIDAKVADPSGS